MKHFYALISLLLFGLLVVACSPFVPVTGVETPSNTDALVNQQSTISALETLLALPSVTPTVTVTLTPTPTNTNTPTPTNTNTPTPTNTNTPTSEPSEILTATPALSPTLTSTPTSTLTNTPASTNTPTPTKTPTATSTPVVIPCNQAEFVADVTIPDGTMIEAGAAFTKTWRIRNIGTCTWSSDYRIVFVSGINLGGPDYMLLGTSVAPGQVIDISLVLIAPNTSGTFKSTYQLADASGSTFRSTGGSGGSFFVLIQQGLTPYSPYALVSLSTRRIQTGKEFIVYVSGFPANSEIDYQFGHPGEAYSFVYDGTIGVDGTAMKNLTIPSDALAGEYWFVKVSTTSQKDGVTVSSPSIYITNSYTSPSGDLQVSLSTTQTHAGGVVIVYISGFPANAAIDLMVGEQGKAYSVVYDATVGVNGTTIETISIPTNALNGQYWVVKVTTTNLPNGITVTSHTIYITN